MKIPLLFTAFLAVGVLVFDLQAGSVQRANLSADEVASAMDLLGVKTSSFDCTFDAPVYCQLTWMSRKPGDLKAKIAHIETRTAAKTIRLNWCVLDARLLALSLGLAAPSARKMVKFTVTPSGGGGAPNLIDYLTSPEGENPLLYDDLVTTSDFGEHPRIALDTEVPLFGLAQANSSDREPGTASSSIDEITRHDHYELATVRFSTKPIPPQ